MSGCHGGGDHHVVVSPGSAGSWRHELPGGNGGLLSDCLNHKTNKVVTTSEDNIVQLNFKQVINSFPYYSDIYSKICLCLISILRTLISTWNLVLTLHRSEYALFEMYLNIMITELKTKRRNARNNIKSHCYDVTCNFIRTTSFDFRPTFPAIP